MSHSFRFGEYPRDTFDMYEASQVFIKEWRALFPLVLANINKPDTVMWAEKRNPEVPLHDDKDYIVTAVDREEVRSAYMELQCGPDSNGTVCTDTAMPDGRLRLSHHISRGESLRDIYVTEFYRGDRPAPLVGDNAPQALDNAYLTWSADLGPGRLTRLYKETFAPGEITDRRHVLPVDHDDPHLLFRSFSESEPRAEEAEIYFQHGPYAATFDQLQSTLQIICHLAGEDHAKPWAS